MHISFIEALSTLPKIKIYYGTYQIKKSFDKNIQQHVTYPIEKKSDVNLACQLLLDAFKGNFDYAYIISADSDLLPPMEIIKENFPYLTLVACLPPRRSSSDIKATTHEIHYIKEIVLSRSQLPLSVTKPDGTVLNKPEEWF